MTATLIPEPVEPGSDAWLRTISASKVAAIVGLSPWATPHSLWHTMRGTTPREPQTSAQSRGHEFEPLIRRWFADAHPDWFVTETSAWRNDDRPWQTADPDGLIYTDSTQSGPMVGLEVKTAADLRDWGAPGTDQVPDYYRVQAVWQMDTLCLPSVIFAVCGPFELFDRRPREYVVAFDPGEAEELRAAANAFRMSLTLGIEPPADYRRDGDRQVLRWQHPAVIDTSTDLPDEVAVPWLQALADSDAATEREAVARAQLVRFLGDGRNAVWRGTTLGSRRRGRGDNPPAFSRTRGLNPTELLTPDTELQEAS